MASVLHAGALVDAHAVLHGLSSEPPTYSRGKRRLDYMFISRHLVPNLVRTGIEPFNQRIFSDHRGLFIDLEYKGLFDRYISPIVSPSDRHLRSDNSTQIRKYLTTLHPLLVEKMYPNDSNSSKKKLIQ